MVYKVYTEQPAKVEAVQFIESRLPWPDGVTVDTRSSSGYMYNDGQYLECTINTGDYIVKGTREPAIIKQSDFEQQYEVQS